MVTNKEYEEALYNSDNEMIMNKAATPFIHQLDPDEILECKLIALWGALKLWKPQGGKVFTSFLYQKVYWECLKTVIAKKKQRSFPSADVDNIVSPQPSTYEILDGLADDLQDVLKKKYIYGMTLREIGEEYGCCYEKIRKQIKKAKKQIKILTKGV
jgi:DNA-directed RNA polymerase specialized sigma24 family protein